MTNVVRLGGSDSPKSRGSVAAALAAAVVVALDDAAEEMTERELRRFNGEKLDRFCQSASLNPSSTNG